MPKITIKNDKNELVEVPIPDTLPEDRIKMVLQFVATQEVAREQLTIDEKVDLLKKIFHQLDRDVSEDAFTAIYLPILGSDKE